VWCWMVACCIQSSRLVYLAWPVPMVCGVEDVVLNKVAECQLLKRGPVALSLCSARFHQSPSSISLGDSFYDTTDITYNYSSDNRQQQGHLTVNTIQYKLLIILAQNQIPMRYTSDVPILSHYPPGASRSLSKSSPADGFTFARGKTNPDCVP